LVHDFRRINPTSTRIILVEGELRIIPTFPASLTRKVRKKLDQFGVEVRTGVHVTEALASGLTDHIVAPRLTCITRYRPLQWTVALFYM
jgi:NADH dehydrogenase FAD-containing subunit